MYLFFWILASMYQCEACLDLLVRAFNEVFSPIIETGDERIEQPHDVDELTNYYKTDEDGNIIMNENSWNVANPYLQNSLVPKRISSSSARAGNKIDHQNNDVNANIENEKGEVSKSFGQIGFDNYEETERIDCKPSITNLEPAPDFIVSNPQGQSSDTADYESYHPRGSYYVPGKRPLTDLIIKVLEMFQLTSTSKFIESRPKFYPKYNNQNSKTLRYSPSTYDNYNR